MTVQVVSCVHSLTMMILACKHGAGGFGMMMMPWPWRMRCVYVAGSFSSHACAQTCKYLYLDARIVRVESLSANECGINLFGMTGPAHHP